MNITQIKLIILSLATLVILLGLLLLLSRDFDSSILSFLEESISSRVSSTLISPHSTMFMHKSVVSITAHPNSMTEICHFHLARLDQAIDLVAHNLTAVGNDSIVGIQISQRVGQSRYAKRLCLFMAAFGALAWACGGGCCVFGKVDLGFSAVFATSAATRASVWSSLALVDLGDKYAKQNQKLMQPTEEPLSPLRTVVDAWRWSSKKKRHLVVQPDCRHLPHCFGPVLLWSLEDEEIWVLLQRWLVRHASPSSPLLPYQHRSLSTCASRQKSEIVASSSQSFVSVALQTTCSSGSSSLPLVVYGAGVEATTNLFCCFQTVHDGHLNIHEHQMEATSSPFVDSNLTVESCAPSYFQTLHERLQNSEGGRGVFVAVLGDLTVGVPSVGHLWQEVLGEMVQVGHDPAVQKRLNRLLDESGGFWRGSVLTIEFGTRITRIAVTANTTRRRQDRNLASCLLHRRLTRHIRRYPSLQVGSRPEQHMKHRELPLLFDRRRNMSPRSADNTQDKVRRVVSPSQRIAVFSHDKISHIIDQVVFAHSDHATVVSTNNSIRTEQSADDGSVGTAQERLTTDTAMTEDSETAEHEWILESEGVNEKTEDGGSLCWEKHPGQRVGDWRSVQYQAWVVQVARNLMSFVAEIRMVDTLLGGGRWLRVEYGSGGDAGAVAVAGRRIRGRARQRCAEWIDRSREKCFCCLLPLRLGRAVAPAGVLPRSCLCCESASAALERPPEVLLAFVFNVYAQPQLPGLSTNKAIPSIRFHSRRTWQDLPATCISPWPCACILPLLISRAPQSAFCVAATPNHSILRLVLLHHLLPHPKLATTPSSKYASSVFVLLGKDDAVEVVWYASRICLAFDEGSSSRRRPPCRTDEPINSFSSHQLAPSEGTYHIDMSPVVLSDLTRSKIISFDLLHVATKRISLFSNLNCKAKLPEMMPSTSASLFLNPGGSLTNLLSRSLMSQAPLLTNFWYRGVSARQVRVSATMSLIVRCAVRASKTGGSLSVPSTVTRSAMLGVLLVALPVDDEMVLTTLSSTEFVVP
ncbi:hypothetical protein KCU65_g34, partial [Aureobasidium melanogenum]